jgi:hypothetical protein
MAAENIYHCFNEKDEVKKEKKLLEEIDSYCTRMQAIKQKCSIGESINSAVRDSETEFLFNISKNDQWKYLKDKIIVAFAANNYIQAFDLVDKALDNLKRKTEFCLSDGHHAFSKKGYLDDMVPSLPLVGTFFSNKTHEKFEHGLKKTEEHLILIKEWVGKLEHYFTPGIIDALTDAIQKFTHKAPKP